MSKNPFEVTKAVDFTDEQIANNWVDLPGGGFYALADPRSPMPKFLVGGKGGGRTHLLRYYSYALQRLRHQDNTRQGIQHDGYIGIYFRCGGLNSSRFSGKGQDTDTWAAIFSLYTEIWLGRLTIDLIRNICSTSGSSTGDEVWAFARTVTSLFDVELELNPDDSDPLTALASAFHKAQKGLDVAINNAALSRHLDVNIHVTPGRLVFGIPAAALQHLPIFSGLIFAYLLDEFENLTVEQQKYVNTLIREKQLPTTFLVGSRQYGLRTHVTLSAGEENKQGSEYELVVLEETYRSQGHSYSNFCKDIVRKRLQAVDMEVGPKTRLNDFFYSQHDNGKDLEERAIFHAKRKLIKSPPWLEQLRAQLADSVSKDDTLNLLSQVSFSESPLHEKFAIFLLYRDWADGHNLVEAATLNRQNIQRLLGGSEDSRKVISNISDTKFVQSYDHYKHDLYAQVLEELGINQEYYGLDTFVALSGYLPRNLIVLLKQVTRWSTFFGEQPYRGGRVSLKAQSEGVREASEWFLSDAKGLGRIGDETELAIRRLGSLFRDMRFSNKPVEVSCSAFTTDYQGLSSSATLSLESAVSHSLILKVPTGRRDRNSRVLQRKYQLNPMLAPMFDLSPALRGCASFSSAELNAIFDASASERGYNNMRNRLLSRLQAPFRTDLSQEALRFD